MRTTCRAAITIAGLASALVAAEPLSGQAFDPGRDAAVAGAGGGARHSGVRRRHRLFPVARPRGGGHRRPDRRGPLAHGHRRHQRRRDLRRDHGRHQPGDRRAQRRRRRLGRHRLRPQRRASADGPTRRRMATGLDCFWARPPATSSSPVRRAAASTPSTPAPARRAGSRRSRSKAVDLGVPAGGPPRPRRRRLLHLRQSRCRRPGRARGRLGPPALADRVPEGARAVAAHQPGGRADRGRRPGLRLGRRRQHLRARSRHRRRALGVPQAHQPRRRLPDGGRAPTPTTARSCGPAG